MITIVLCASLGWEGEGDILATGFSNDDLLLFNSVGSINKLGNIKALVFNQVLALNLGDLNGLCNADFLGSRIGKRARDLKRDSDEGNLVSLGLVFLATHLVFSMSISWRSISRSSTSGHLHSLRLLLISDLGGCAGSCHIFPFVYISTDLSVHYGGGLLAHGKDTIEAVVIVHNLLDCKSDWGHLLSESWNADLSIDRCVCVPAMVLRGIAISWLCSSGERDQRREENDLNQKEN